MIMALERYWAGHGCVLAQPYHTELAAGTMNPNTFLRCLGPKPWQVAYVEPSIRPLDGRYGENPFRFQHYFQYQVVLKPAPENVLDLYWASLEALGIDLAKHDMRLVEDDWEQPTLGAWGLGWEVWCDGMEITQWTYFQQLGGVDVELVPAEMTYGLERPRSQARARGRAGVPRVAAGAGGRCRRCCLRSAARSCPRRHAGRRRRSSRNSRRSSSRSSRRSSTWARGGSAFSPSTCRSGRRTSG